jgi:hypothetical protein
VATFAGLPLAYEEPCGSNHARCWLREYHRAEAAEAALAAANEKLKQARELVGQWQGLGLVADKAWARTVFDLCADALAAAVGEESEER